MTISDSQGPLEFLNVQMHPKKHKREDRVEPCLGVLRHNPLIRIIACGFLLPPQKIFVSCFSISSDENPRRNR